MKPQNCRNRLRDEGKPYPKSGCASCGNGGMMGCPYDKGNQAMTNDKQVEVWRKEFIEISRTKRDTSFFDGRFLDDRTEILFHGFLIAKRNQPVIELPAIESSEGYYEYSEVFEAITAAGYRYMVK